MNPEEYLKKEYIRYRLEKSRIRDWTFRVMAELKQHSTSCVVTFTYDKEHLPVGASLDVRDVQLFFKRLRKTGVNVRYFGCAEYGKRGLRPHYHLILFGYCPNDCVYFKTVNGRKYYLSKSLHDIWQNGFILVDKDVTADVIPYVSKYMQKFNVLPSGVRKPFMLMSRKPGIGACALDNGDVDLRSDKLYSGGKWIRIPRYYLKRLDRLSAAKGKYSDLKAQYWSDVDIIKLKRALYYSEHRQVSTFNRGFQKWLKLIQKRYVRRE